MEIVSEQRAHVFASIAGLLKFVRRQSEQGLLCWKSPAGLCFIKKDQAVVSRRFSARLSEVITQNTSLSTLLRWLFIVRNCSIEQVFPAELWLNSPTLFPNSFTRSSKPPNGTFSAMLFEQVRYKQRRYQRTRLSPVSSSLLHRASHLLCSLLSRVRWKDC